MMLNMFRNCLYVMPDSPEEAEKLCSLFETYEREGKATTFGSIQDGNGPVTGIFLTVGVESVKNVFGLMNAKAADKFQVKTRGDHSQN